MTISSFVVNMNLAATNNILFMMQTIVIATTQDNQCGHFDQCLAYTIVEMDMPQKRIVKTTSLASSGLALSKRLQLVQEAGAQLIIATQMDGPLQLTCVEQGIPPLLNVQGMLPDIIKAFMQNTLDYGDTDHDHHYE